MTKKQWKTKYKELEEAYNELASEHGQLFIDYKNKKDLCDRYSNKCTILAVENKNTKKQLTQSILDSSLTIEQTEDQEQEKRLELIEKYSSLKREHRIDTNIASKKYEELRRIYTVLYDKHEQLELIHAELLNQHKEK